MQKSAEARTLPISIWIAPRFHFVKENEIISGESRSSEQFVHGIKVLMARNYSQNLAEETIKGITETYPC